MRSATSSNRAKTNRGTGTYPSLAGDYSLPWLLHFPNDRSL